MTDAHPTPDDDASRPPHRPEKPEKPEKRENKGGLVALLTVSGVLALLALAYVGLHAMAGDRVPRDTSVAGVDIGEDSPAEAEAALESGLSTRRAAPITVTVGDREVEVDPAAAGLDVDLPATVERAGGGDGGWSPGRLWSYFTGGGEVDPVVTVDEPALAAQVQRLATGGAKPKNATVAFDDGEIVTTNARDGEGVDTEKAAALLREAYLSDDPAVSLESEALEPPITDADVQAALDDFANPAVSGPVTLRFDTTPLRIFPKDFTAALSMKPRGGSLVPVLDRTWLQGIVEDRLADDGEPVDARIEMVDGKPRVIPSKPGVSYRPQDVSGAFLDAVVAAPGKREVAVEATARDADFTTAEARKLGVKEKISTFTTNFPYAEYRNVNIGRAAELVNNTLVKPGEDFSLNDTVGERTAENGFTTGFIISDGIFKEDLGGGVSQMATTAFNAGFFGGMTDVEHKPHSFYIDRYPEGREATVAWPTLDMRWGNDTPYGVLVEAVVTPSTPSTQGAATVTLWSTKYWDIDTRTSERYNFTSPGTRTLDTSDCYPNTGYGGFDVDVWRDFTRHGSDEVVRTQKLHTTYIPSDTVVCVEPGSDGAD